jgi:hypothetical protein
MSPSPTGPGFLMRASTPAARKMSRERTSRSLTLSPSFAERFNCPSSPSAQPEANLKGLKQATFDRDGRGNGLDDKMALIAVSVGMGRFR